MSAPRILEDLAQMTVLRFVIDDSLSLECRRADGLAAVIRFDDEIVLEGSHPAHRFSVDRDPAACGPVIALLHEPVQAATVMEDGTLRLSVGGRVLSAPPSAYAMAWSVTTSNGFAAHCLAEGRVVVGGPSKERE